MTDLRKDRFCFCTSYVVAKSASSAVVDRLKIASLRCRLEMIALFASKLLPQFELPNLSTDLFTLVYMYFFKHVFILVHKMQTLLGLLYGRFPMECHTR
jgi:hypothetical protein